MTRKRVNSTDVLTLGWESATGYVTADSIGTLEVEFKRGRTVYQYFNVPVFVYREIERAHSVGAALHRLVKAAGYDYKQVA